MINFEWYKQRNVYYYSGSLTCASVEFGKGSRVNQFEWCLSQQPATADCPRCWMTENVQDIRAYTVATDRTLTATKTTASTTTKVAVTTKNTKVELADKTSAPGKHKVVPSATLTWEETLRIQLQFLDSGDVRSCFAFASPYNKAQNGPLANFEKVFRAKYSNMINSEWHGERDVYYYSRTLTCASVVFGKGSRVDQFEWCLSQQPATADCPGCWMTENVEHIRTYTIRPKHLLTTTETMTRSGTTTIVPEQPLTTTKATTPTSASTRAKGIVKHDLVPSATLTWEQVLQAQLQFLHEGDVRSCFAFASPQNKAFTGPVENFEKMIRGSYSSMLNSKWYKKQEILARGTAGSKCAFVVFGKGSRVEQFKWCLSQQPATADCPGCWMTDSVMHTHGYSFHTIAPEHPVETDKTATGIGETPKDDNNGHIRHGDQHHHDHAGKQHHGRPHYEGRDKENVKGKHGHHHRHDHNDHHDDGDKKHKHRRHDHHARHHDKHEQRAVKHETNTRSVPLEIVFCMAAIAVLVILLSLIIFVYCVLRNRQTDRVSPMGNVANQELKNSALGDFTADVIGKPVRDDDVVLVVGRSIE